MTRRLTIMLAASLLLNVFAIGAIGGGLIMLWRPGLLRPVAGARPIRAAGDDLPQPDRDQFRIVMRQAIQANRDLGRMARENREEAAWLFVRPQFDQGAVSAALAHARDADLLLRSRLEEAAVQFAATLPADQRTLLAQGLEHGGPLRHPQLPAGAAAKSP